LPPKKKRADKNTRAASQKEKNHTKEKKDKKPKSFDDPEKPMKRKRRGEDTTGFEVFDVDGTNNYRCEICGKILFRRLQSHRAIHTTER
jgi:rubrerythrin